MNKLPKQIVLASGNKGKLKELQSRLAELAVDIIPQSQFAIVDADETGLSFVENAIIKARHAAKLSGLPAIADDSGLEVDYLHGQPGIYSGRWAEKADGTRDFSSAIDRVAKEMANKPLRFLADQEKDHTLSCLNLLTLFRKSQELPLLKRKLSLTLLISNLKR